MADPLSNLNLEDLHPGDVADTLRELPPEELFMAFLLLPADRQAKVFAHFSLNLQEMLLKKLGAADTAELLERMAPDDRTGLFENFPDRLIKQSIQLLSEEERAIALNLLGYPKDCVARLMTPHFVQIKEEWTVGQALAHIKKFGQKAETLNFLYVVDKQKKLIDDIMLGSLLLAEEDQKISELMDYSFVSLITTLPKEDAIPVFEKYDRAALPVVTESGVLVGIVTFDDIMDEVEKRDTEDIHKIGGSEALDLSYQDTSLLQMVKKRGGWLVLLLLGEMLTATAMGHYEEEIARAVVLALFVPLIISSGGNSGAQAATLIIRALAIREINLQDWWQVLRKELMSGFLLGLILGTVGFARIALWENLGISDYGPHWMLIGLTLGATLTCIVMLGTLLGSMIPFLLKKVKLDPATSSAPFVATLVDVTGLIIYFTIASAILSGTLL